MKDTWAWEEHAKFGDPMPEGLPLEDQMAYVGIQYISLLETAQEVQEMLSPEERIELFVRAEHAKKMIWQTYCGYRKRVQEQWEQIRREKAALSKKRAQDQSAFEANLAAYRARLIKATELACSECRKNPTPENAIRLCNVIDGIHLPSELRRNG